MTTVNFDPNLIPIYDKAKNIFDVLYQMHPELKASSIDWHKITLGNHSQDINVAIELYVPKITQMQIVIAKQEGKTEPVVICPNGKILNFVNLNQQTLDGKKFKLLVLTIGKSVNHSDNSRININHDENVAEKDFIAIYYIPPQTTKDDIPVGETIYIYNVAADEILYRYLYGKKRTLVPILFQVASFWRSQNSINENIKNNYSSSYNLDDNKEVDDYSEETKETKKGFNNFAVPKNNTSFIENQLSNLINHIQSQNSSSISNFQMLNRIQNLESQLLVKQTEDKYQHYITEQSKQMDKLLELNKQLIETINQSLKNIHSPQQPIITNTITTPKVEESQLHDIKKDLKNVMESLKEKSIIEEESKKFSDEIENELVTDYNKARDIKSIN